MKIVIVMCPECGQSQKEKVQEKTTSVCNNCHWPVDVYEDGTINECPLIHAHSDVYTSTLARLDIRTKKSLEHFEINARYI